jgi:hypothetical protein
VTGPLTGAAGVAARSWAAGTAAAGAVALLRAQQVARLVSGRGAAPGPAVVRILGARQLLQGTAILVRPTPLLLFVGATVDVLHAASMVAAAVIWSRYRRPALTSAAVAATSGAAGAGIIRRGQR